MIHVHAVAVRRSRSAISAFPPNAKSALAPHALGDPKNRPFPVHSGVRVARRPIKVWSELETRKFLTSVRGNRYEALYRLALDSGARQGEIFGLRWRDLRDGSIVIQGSLGQATRRVGRTKTLASRRQVVLQRSTLDALAEYRTRQASEKAPVDPDDLIFGSPHGKPIHASNFYRREFVPAIERAKVPLISATLLLGRSVPAKIVQERLEHSSIRVTMDTYSHVLPHMEQSAVDAVQAVFDDLSEPNAGPGHDS